MRLYSLVPKYRGIPIYRVKFWELLGERILKGYDESITWDFRYYGAKWLYPRLLKFYDQIRKSGTCPQSYEDKMRSIYLKNGFEYDKHWHRFADKNIEHEMRKDAINMWEEDVWLMCDTFRDMLEEDEHWERWKKNWEFDVKAAQTMYDMISGDKNQKVFWESYGFERAWYPSIHFTEEDFSQRKRKEGLTLFAENFQNLWW